MAPAMAVVPLVLPPKWDELPGDKQQILAPLAGEWDQLEAWRRKKWLDVAERYPRMGKEEQERIQRRMKAWVALTPEERRAAREKYRNVRQASPEQREALKNLWKEYQALPDDEKRRLEESAVKSSTRKPGMKSAAKSESKPAGGQRAAEPLCLPVLGDSALTPATAETASRPVLVPGLRLQPTPAAGGGSKAGNPSRRPRPAVQ